jgi:hypothetical protein
VDVRVRASIYYVYQRKEKRTNKKEKNTIHVGKICIYDVETHIEIIYSTFIRKLSIGFYKSGTYGNIKLSRLFLLLL